MARRRGQSRSGAGRAGKKAVMVAVVAAALLVDLVLAHAILGGALRIPLHIRMPLTEALRLWGYANNAGPINMTYNGSIVVALLARGSNLSAVMPIGVRFLRNGTASRAEINLTIPQVAAVGRLDSLSYTVLANATDRYFCGKPLPYGARQQNGYECVSGKNLGVAINATGNSELLNLSAALNDMNVTFEWVAPSLYNWDLCGLAMARFSGSFVGAASALHQFLNGTNRDGYWPYRNVSALNGTLTTCVSMSGVPLFIRLNATVSVPRGYVSMAGILNETVIGRAPHQVDVSALPGRLLSLRDLLPGSCVGFGTVDLHDAAGCGGLLMNTSGMLRFNYAQGNVSVDILGLACIASTSAYNRAPYAAPPLGSFTGVNVTTVPAANATLYIDCGLNSTRLGTQFNGYVWAYYSYGGAITAGKIAQVTAYSTTNATLGVVENTGPVEGLSGIIARELLPNCSVPPQVALAENANLSQNLIAVGTQYDNPIIARIFSEYNISETGGPILGTYGPNRLLVAGRNASSVVMAATGFIHDINAAAAPGSAPDPPLEFHGMAIINAANEPVVQIVVGPTATKYELGAAEEIAAAIRNDSAYGGKTCARQ